MRRPYLDGASKNPSVRVIQNGLVTRNDAAKKITELPDGPADQNGLTPRQLKILQEAITLTVFIPFVVFYMHQPLKLDYLWAGLCILGAVYFVFRT